MIVQRKNILLLIRSLGKGGAETQLSILAAGLAGIGYKITVLTYYSYANTKDNLNFTRLQNAGIEVLCVGKRGRYDLFGFLLRYIKMLKLNKPDIIYSFLELSNIFACFAKLIVPDIKIVWGKRSSNRELKQYKLSVKLEHKLEQYLSFIPNLIIANSNKGFDNLIANRYKSKIKVVQNGIDTDLHYKKTDTRFSLFNTCSISKEDILIGAVGRIDYAKDYETLIKAFNLTIRHNERIKLLIVGREVQSDYAKKIYLMVKEYQLEQKVFFIPEMENVSQFYSSIDIFVSSSATEGFSNVIAEAMAHKLPCVVTDVGDNSLLVGDCGLIVPSQNPNALSEGILDIFNARIDYGELARERVMRQFSTNKMIQTTCEYLEEMYEN